MVSTLTMFGVHQVYRQLVMEPWCRRLSLYGIVKGVGNLASVDSYPGLGTFLVSASTRLDMETSLDRTVVTSLGAS
jgi:ABC-type dipeptide/oligopeptide/nickel transport system permease component